MMSDSQPQRTNDASYSAPPGRATFLFSETSAEALIKAIEDFGAVPKPYDIPPQNHYWIYPSDSDRFLELHVIRDIDDYEIDLTEDALTEWWWPLKSALGADPDVALTVYVRDGQLAEQAMRSFAVTVLGIHAGIVQDDNSSHAWTLDEIRDGTVRGGFEFFRRA